ncbi:MAG TPA: hypothetical protein VK008_00710 [Sphingobacteriaceae bacterium]|nr:hypothetical protein [Sphingobacteriaceae bacterium]
MSTLLGEAVKRGRAGSPVKELGRKTRPALRPNGRNGSGGGSNGGMGGPGGAGARAPILSNGRVGLWFLLGSITMLFGGFTSTVLVRRLADDWSVMPIPSMVWASTAALILSSITAEVARRQLRSGRIEGALNWISVTAVGGLLFVAGQWMAWQQLLGQGIMIQSSARSGFVYLLMAVHALHVIGGIVGLTLVYRKVTRLRGAVAMAAANGGGVPLALAGGRGAIESLSNFNTYWHFMGGLWIYLLILLFVS